MKNRILISQRISKVYNEIRCELSTEWTELFNNFKDTELIPIHINTNFESDSNISGIIISGGNSIFQKKE